jgi:16S rRNA (uracil1498-N3)-methyltransferase
MERVFAPDGPTDGQITLDRDEAHHLTRVRRVEIGKPVIAFDGQGHAWFCHLADSTKSTAVLEVQSEITVSKELAAPAIWVGTAVPKGDRFDWIIEKATELGVAHLVPLRCDRSVVDPRSTKLDRLRRSVIEACKQCGRNDLMTIDPPSSLTEFLASLAAGELGLIADQGGMSMTHLVHSSLSVNRVKVCVGPEGGWTSDERQLAQSYGWMSVGLGPHILRIETAVVAAASAIHSCDWTMNIKGAPE